MATLLARLSVWKRGAALGALCSVLSGYVAAQDLAAEDVVSCLLLPWESISVSAPSDGVVQEIFVERGEQVTKGQLIVQLDDRVQKSYLDLMRAKAEDGAGVELARVRLEVAKSGFERNRPIADRKQITGDEWDRIRGTYELAVIELEQARNAAVQASLELARARAAHSQTQVLAPADAVVVKRLIAVGEAAGTEPLLELAVIDRLRVEVFAPAASFLRWKGADAVTLAVVLPSERTLDAQVRTVDAVSDAGTGAISVLLEVDNQAGDMLPGQFCQIADGAQ